MKIIISPAKTMLSTSDYFSPSTKPIFLKKANKIHSYLKILNKNELKNLYKCNDKLVDLNYNRLIKYDSTLGSEVAIMSYYGLQFQHIKAHLMDDSELEYLQEHLVILSGLYGIVRPFDGVIQYRLEAQAKIDLDEYNSLYDYWADDVSAYLKDEIVINLASEEYSKLVKSDNIYNVIFYVKEKGLYKIKATIAKIARGGMVRYMASNNVQTLDALKWFSDYGFKYSVELSKDNNVVFIKK